MPIHFSIGFVVDSSPQKPFEYVCAVANDVDVVTAAACRQQAVSSVVNTEYILQVEWPRKLGWCL